MDEYTSAAVFTYEVSMLSLAMSKEFVSLATPKAAVKELELFFENNSVLWITDSK